MDARAASTNKSTHFNYFIPVRDRRCHLIERKFVGGASTPPKRATPTKARDQAVYWKDGVAINLTTEGTFSMANSIYVQGTDVHVAGYEHGHPAYWKNEKKQDISNQDKFGQVEFVVVGSN